MNKVLALLGVLLAVVMLNACQTTDIVPTITTDTIDTPTDSISQTPLRTNPVDVLNSFIAPQAITPQAVAIAQGNLFDNGGFESGLAGWTACAAGAIAESTNAYEGNKALKVNAGNCFYRSVEVTPGQELALSCYVRIESGSGWTGLGLGFADASWTTIDGGPSTIVTGNTYQRYDVEATAPAGSKYVSMWMYSDNPALVDECTLMLEQDPPDPPGGGGDNLLDNGDFETLNAANKPVNWTKGCGGSWSSVTQNGSKAMRVNSNACVDQSLSATDISSLKGKDYTYSCDVNNTNSYASMTIFLDGVAKSTVIPFTNNAYQRIEVTGTAGEISNGFVSLYASGSMFVDNCKLEVEGIDPPGGGDELLENGNFSETANADNWNIGCGGQVGPRINNDGIWLTEGCLDQGLSASDIAALRGNDYTFSCTGMKGIFNRYGSISIFLNGTPKTTVLPNSSSFDTWEVKGTAPSDLNSGFVSVYTEERLSLAYCSLTVDDSGGPQPGTQQWSDRFGTQDTQNFAQEYVDAVALSSTGIFTVGKVIKDLGSPNTYSLSIRKYAQDGNNIFSNVEDFSGTLLDAATDSAGNLYVVRSTTQNITPAPYRQLDLWLHKYSPNGTKLFEKIIATDEFYGGNSSGSLYYDEMLIEGNNIYVSRRASVRKFDLSGVEQWNAAVSGYGVGGLAATPDGSVYVSVSGFRSYTTSLIKLNSDGTEAWDKTINTTTVGTPPTTYLVANNTHVYVMGGTVDTFTNDSDDRLDGYLWKYDSAGNEIWTSQIATNLTDRLTSADLYDGALYTTGRTGTQGFIKKINLTTAAEEWSVDLDVDGYDIFNDIAVDSTGIYAGGYVAGIAQSGNNTPIANSSDAYIVKYSLP